LGVTAVPTSLLKLLFLGLVCAAAPSGGRASAKLAGEAATAVAAKRKKEIADE